MTTTATIAARLTALCTEGKFIQAQEELYDFDIVHIETDGTRFETLPVMLEKEQQFLDNIEKINQVEFSEPLIAGGYFTVKLIMDIKLKNIGRKRLEELCIYQVVDGKIVFEQFFRDK